MGNHAWKVRTVSITELWQSRKGEEDENVAAVGTSDQETQHLGFWYRGIAVYHVCRQLGVEVVRYTNLYGSC